jgi:hypothetical protein
MVCMVYGVWCGVWCVVYGHTARTILIQHILYSYSTYYTHTAHTILIQHIPLRPLSSPRVPSWPATQTNEDGDTANLVLDGDNVILALDVGC